LVSIAQFLNLNEGEAGATGVILGPLLWQSWK